MSGGGSCGVTRAWRKRSRSQCGRFGATLCPPATCACRPSSLRKRGRATTPSSTGAWVRRSPSTASWCLRSLSPIRRCPPRVLCWVCGFFDEMISSILCDGGSIAALPHLQIGRFQNPAVWKKFAV